MSDVLIFTQTPYGDVVATSAVSTQDGQTVSPVGQVVPAAIGSIVTNGLSFIRINTDGSVSQTLFDQTSPGISVTGTDRLKQRFLLHLLTIQGSMLYRPLMGCLFIMQLQIGKANNERDIFSAFAAASVTITTNMQNEEFATDPANERFKIARLLNVTIQNGAVTLNIVITSLSGDLTQLSVPLVFKW